MSETVVLTGASGFIAKHIALRLLTQGYHVRGTIRSMKRADEVRDALRPHLEDPVLLESRLSFAELDLSKDEGWDEACVGADIVMHTASPFPFEQPRDENELIGPAVEGALRALKAAHRAGVKRFIITSSVVAIMEGHESNQSAFDETDWSNVDSPDINAYSKSKTLAERAVWDYAEKHAPDMQITSINPGLVLGPSLDANYGTSLQIIERIVTSKDPMLPNFGINCVDVRDIADMHVKAIDTEASFGQRLAGVSAFIWYPDLAKLLAKAYPDRKIATRRAPNFMIKLYGMISSGVRSVVPSLDVRREVSNARARQILGMEFRSVDEAARSAAETILEHGKL